MFSFKAAWNLLCLAYCRVCTLQCPNRSTIFWLHRMWCLVWVVVHTEHGIDTRLLAVNMRQFVTWTMNVPSSSFSFSDAKAHFWMNFHCFQSSVHFQKRCRSVFPTTCSFKCLTPVLLTVCLKIFLRCHIYFWGKVDGVKFEDEWSVRQSPGTG